MQGLTNWADDPKDYIHRVGRTARGANVKGKSLIFLQPHEGGFLSRLREARVPLTEFELPEKKLLNIQSQLEKLISSNYYLNKVCIDHNATLRSLHALILSCRAQRRATEAT
jgi:ATP-dependent RNA helicase DDX18/HAS1